MCRGAERAPSAYKNTNGKPIAQPLKPCPINVLNILEPIDSFRESCFRPPIANSGMSILQTFRNHPRELPNGLTYGLNRYWGTALREMNDAMRSCIPVGKTQYTNAGEKLTFPNVHCIYVKFMKVENMMIKTQTIIPSG
jgi:hypothetical protein